VSEGVAGATEMVAVKFRQEFVRGDVSRALRDGDKQFTFGFVKTFRFDERLAEKRVEPGLKVEQAQRFDRRGDGFIKSMRSKMNARQLGVDEGIFGIFVESGFEQLTCFVHFAQLHESGGDALTEVVVYDLGSRNFFQKWTRLSGSFFEQELTGKKPFDEQRTAMSKFAQLAFFELVTGFVRRVIFGAGGASVLASR